MSDVMKGQLRFLNLLHCHLMTTTPEPTAMDLTKVANATESTCPSVNVPHVQSPYKMRPIVYETSDMLVIELYELHPHELWSMRKTLECFG